MTDHYIDQDETQIYGPWAAAQIRKRAVGLVPELDPGLEHLAKEIEDATAAVKRAIDGARDADARIRAGSTDKGPLLERGIRLLGRFSKHLDSHEGVDKRKYFTRDGTATGVGRSAHRVLLALNDVARVLASDASVHDRDRWLTELKAAAADLAPRVEHASSAKTDRATMTPEVEGARAAWLSVYAASKSVVEGVLRLAGRLEQLATIFYDLAVPGGTKVTAPPAEPPAPSPAVPAGG